MTPHVAERLRWVVDRLDVGPRDRVLEIGCGAGGAAALVAERLGTGSILALDRSRAMITMAVRSHRTLVVAGRVRFVVGAFEDVDLAAARFDSIFAVNVGVFLRDPALSLAKVSAHARPRARLHLVHQPPTAAKLGALADRQRAALEEHGFEVHDVIRTVDPVPSVCLVADARPRRGRSQRDARSAKH